MGGVDLVLCAARHAILLLRKHSISHSRVTRERNVQGAFTQGETDLSPRAGRVGLGMHDTLWAAHYFIGHCGCFGKFCSVCGSCSVGRGPFKYAAFYVGCFLYVGYIVIKMTVQEFKPSVCIFKLYYPHTIFLFAKKACFFIPKLELLLNIM